jgi:hypothetical protein
MDYFDLVDRIAFLLRYRDKLNDFEKKFVEGIARITRSIGPMTLTDAQYKTFCKVYAKAAYSEQDIPPDDGKRPRRKT